jgi:MYXO-CTERM domain-containing protein
MGSSLARACALTAVFLTLFAGGPGYAAVTTATLTGPVTHSEFSGTIPSGSLGTAQFTYDDAAAPYGTFDFGGYGPTPTWHVSDFSFSFVDGSTITAPIADLFVVTTAGYTLCLVDSGGMMSTTDTTPTSATGSFASALLDSSDFNLLLADPSGTAVDSSHPLPGPTAWSSLFLGQGHTSVKLPGVDYTNKVFFDITPSATEPAAVPAPGVLALGLFGLLFVRRRRRSSPPSA